MSYNVRDKEVVAILQLAPNRRMAYFIGKVADWGEIWSVGKNDAWSLMADDDGHELIPVWPAEAFASLLCRDQWSDRRPKALPLQEFMAKWIPGACADGRHFAVFPTPNHHGMVVAADELEQRLTDGLAQYE